MIRIAASASPGEIRLAVLDGATLQDFALWRPGQPDGLGDVHWARITARVPAMAGAFVAMADGEGFLPDSDGAAGRTEGDMLAVRITRTAQGGKGPRLATADMPGAEKGWGPPRRLAAGPTPLQRLAASYPGAPVTIDDAALYASLKPEFADRLSFVAAAFDDTIETALDALQSARVALPGGLIATITPTPALTAIDMDGGASTAARGLKSTIQFAANRAAIPALMRQLRLRNLSGAILIDLAGMPVRRRAALGPDFTRAMAVRPCPARACSASPGLAWRKSCGRGESAPLHEVLAGPLAAGLAALRAAGRTSPGAAPCCGPRLAWWRRCRRIRWRCRTLHGAPPIP